eukprot:PhF_6_TR19934/c0_g1_i2/m.29003
MNLPATPYSPGSWDMFTSRPAGKLEPSNSEGKQVTSVNPECSSEYLLQYPPAASSRGVTSRNPTRGTEPTACGVGISVGGHVAALATEPVITNVTYVRAQDVNNESFFEQLQDTIGIVVSATKELKYQWSEDGKSYQESPPGFDSFSPGNVKSDVVESVTKGAQAITSTATAVKDSAMNWITWVKDSVTAEAEPQPQQPQQHSQSQPQNPPSEKKSWIPSNPWF